MDNIWKSVIPEGRTLCKTQKVWTTLYNKIHIVKLEKKSLTT